jgi:hypothetical protein
MSNQLLKEFKSIKQIDQELPRYLKRNIGQGVYISKRSKIGDNTYLITVGNSYPAFVHRPINKPPIIKFINIDNISAIKIEKKEKKNIFEVSIPPRDEMIDKNDEKYNSLIISAENSLMDQTYLNYVNIPLVQTAMSRIKSVLIVLEYDTQINPSDHPSSERHKLLKYLKFLEELEYVRKENELYVEGNRLNVIKHELSASNENREKFYNKLMADVLKIGYPYMKKHLRLLQIVPYLRIATAYYLPSYEFNELLEIKRHDFTSFIADYLYSFYNIRSEAYRGKTDAKLNNQIDDVINSNILQIQKDNVIGHQDIFSGFSKSLIY